MNVAIILAGGIGSRFQKTSPKQYIVVDGKPIIQYTIEAFSNNTNIDFIAVVCADKYSPLIKKIFDDINIQQQTAIISNGQERYESVYNALHYLKDYCDKDDKLLFHDAVRPLLTEDIIDNALLSLNTYDCSLPFVPINDGFLQQDDYGNIYRGNRKLAFCTQTPEAVRFGTILPYYQDINSIKNSAGNISALLDMPYNKKHKFTFVKSNNYNFKITEPEDLYLFKSYLHLKNSSSED